MGQCFQRFHATATFSLLQPEKYMRSLSVGLSLSFTISVFTLGFHLTCAIKGDQVKFQGKLWPYGLWMHLWFSIKLPAFCPIKVTSAGFIFVFTYCISIGLSLWILCKWRSCWQQMCGTLCVDLLCTWAPTGYGSKILSFKAATAFLFRVLYPLYWPVLQQQTPTWAL